MKNLLPLAAVALILCACSAEKREAHAAGDLAALGITNALIVESDLASSGQPTEEQFAGLPATGYTSVICLRAADESGTGWEEENAKELGLRFVRLPIDGNEALNEANARALDEAIRGAGGAKTLVCCGSGNRVGGLLALRARYVQGLTPEQALEYGKRAGLTKSEGAVEEALGLEEN